MEVSTYCFDDEVVEDDGDLATLVLTEPKVFDFGPCLDAITTLMNPKK